MAKTAILSVSDDTGLAELARSLRELEYCMVASSGTGVKIESALGPSTFVNDIEYYAAEAIGRMPPLRKEEASGLLAGRLAAGLEPGIEIVACNFRPPQIRDDRIVRDVGGPHLINAAVMSQRFVLVDPTDYDELIDLLSCSSEDDQKTFRTRMDAKALSALSDYSANLRRLQEGAQMLESGDFTPLGTK